MMILNAQEFFLPNLFSKIGNIAANFFLYRLYIVWFLICIFVSCVFLTFSMLNIETKEASMLKVKGKDEIQ